MREVKFIVHMEPVPKGRPRAAINKTGKLVVYTPQKTIQAENYIRETALKFQEYFPAGTPIAMILYIYRSRPKSLSKKVLLPVQKPDFDNYAKLVMDALEKFVYQSDSQITTALIRKRFGDPPRIEIALTEDHLVVDRDYEF